MKTMIEYKNDGTVWGYVEHLNMWIEFENDEAYYECLESFEDEEDK